MKQIRQGDVLFEKIESLPEGLKEKDKVIALGEVTGHSHRFESENVNVFADKSGQQFCQLQKPAECVHEEHKNVTIPSGIWRVINARELDLSGEVRQVTD